MPDRRGRLRKIGTPLPLAARPARPSHSNDHRCPHRELPTADDGPGAAALPTPNAGSPRHCGPAHHAYQENQRRLVTPGSHDRFDLAGRNQQTDPVPRFLQDRPDPVARRGARLSAGVWKACPQPTAPRPFQRQLPRACGAVSTRLSQHANGPPHERGTIVRNPGDVLLSQGISPQVPSALVGLTAVFGMGTGVSPPLWSPETMAGRAHLP